MERLGLSLQEVLSKTAQGRREVEAQMDKTHPGFHPEEGSIYTGLNEDDVHKIRETLDKVSLRELCEKLRLKEYLGSTTVTTGTLGTAGASYLIPDKIYATLFENARNLDITPMVSNVVDTPGATLKVDAEIDEQYIPHLGSGGGEMPTETMETAQGTITPRLFSINIGITNEMIEDSLFDLMEMHTRVAGKAMGEFSTLMCLYPIMEDHRGTTTTYRVEGAYNAVAAGGTYCYVSDLMEAEAANAGDGFASDVAVIPPEATAYLLKGEGAGQPYQTELMMAWDLKNNPVGTICGMNIVRCLHMNSGDPYEAAATQYYGNLFVSNNAHALVLNKTYGIQTVRKRWLKIENYSDPIKDLAGAVVSARQGHLVAYADACCVISMH